MTIKVRRKVGRWGDRKAGRWEGRKVEIGREVGETTVVGPAGLTFKCRVSLNDYFFSGPRFMR